MFFLVLDQCTGHPFDARVDEGLFPFPGRRKPTSMDGLFSSAIDQAKRPIHSSPILSLDYELVTSSQAPHAE